MLLPSIAAVRRNTQLRRGLGRLAAILLLAACSAAPPAVRPTPTPASPAPPAWVADPAAQALPALVAAERQASIEGNLALLGQLWAEDARVIDGRGTATTADDYMWAGRAAILDRYVLAVFPSPPPPLPADAFADAAIEVNGERATLTRDGDQWHFVHRAGRWWLSALSYGME
jgi:hypothetical protein